MDHSSPLPFLRETLLFLTLAGILIPLLQRLRINQVLGFLTVGIVLGPYGIGQWVQHWPWLGNITFPEVEGVQSFAELGVVFLMFLIGLELSPQRLWSMRRWVFAGGSAQVLLTSLLIGSVAWAFGNTGEVATILGLVLSLSSTAMVMQLLSERRALITREGQSIFAVLMLQDFAVIPLLVLMDLLARDGADSFASSFGLAALKSVMAIGIIYLLGRKLIGPVLRFFTQQRQPEVFMALTLLVTLGIAWVTAAAGLSLALGAFLAGLLMAETEYRHEVEVTIEPFKGLLMGLFFMGVGMGIDPAAVLKHPLWIAASVAGLFLIKASVVAVLFRLGGLRWGQSIESGLLLGQGGEFAFVVVGYALSIGLLEPGVAQFMLLVVSLSLMVTTAAGHLGSWLRKRLDREVAADTKHDELQLQDVRGHVIIAGFGRIGQLMAQVLDQRNIPYIALEQDPQVAKAQREAGKPVYFGNAARLELLAKLETREASALFITMDQPAEAMHTVRSARQACPDLPIYARSRDEVHAHELREAGATGVVPETLEAGLQLAAFALAQAGLNDADIAATIDAERAART